MDDEPPFVAVFDVETQQKITDMPGRFREDKVKLLLISCASVVELPMHLCTNPDDRERAMELSVTKTYWTDGDSHTSIHAMIDRLLKAELIVGFNLVGFDWLLMRKYFSTDEMYHKCMNKTLDVFSRIRDATTTWYKLDALLALNGLSTKTADGLQAIAWWEAGKRAELQEYCEVDVEQCARLALLPTLALSGGRTLANYNFGIASALAGLRAVAPPTCA